MIANQLDPLSAKPRILQEYENAWHGKPHEFPSMPEARKIYLGNSRQISPEN
jgi:hypothetical protein